MKKRLCTIIVAVIITVSFALGLSACTGGFGGNNNDETQDKLWGEVYTMEAAYAQATALGYSGSLQDFIDSISGKNGADGKDGADGVGISSVKLNDKGELVISFTNGASQNIGVIKGSDGKDGVGIASVTANGKGEIVITFTNGVIQNIGAIKGVENKDGVKVRSFEVNKDGKLIITYTDGTEVDLGRFPYCTHAYSEWSTGLVATCTSMGYSMRTCKTCGNIDYEFTQSLGHTPKAAANSLDENYHTFECVDCGQYLVMAHKLTDSGECSVCGYENGGGGEETPVTVSLNKNALALEVGEVDRLTVTVTGSDDVPIVTSSDPAVAIASIVGDKITVAAQATGTADITVSVADKSVTCAVTVSEVKFSLSQSYVMLEDSTQSSIYQDIVTVKGVDSAEVSIVDSSIATVYYANGNATLTAVSVGKTKLIVEAGGETKECVVEVASYGLEYEYVVEVDDDGNEHEYMMVYAGENFNSAKLYIPGYVYCEDLDEYLPVKRMKDAPTNGMGNIMDGGAFQPLEYTVNGEGEKIYDSPIVTAYTGDNVEVIARGAFRHCENLTSVTFGPATVKIDMYAFDSCTSLNNIDWADSQVEMILRCAFAGCGLTEITMPDSVEFLGDAAFSGCNSLSKIALSAKLNEIQAITFLTAEPLNIEIWLPKNITRIAKDAIGCYNGRHNSVVVHYGGTRSEYMAIEYFQSMYDFTWWNMDPEEPHVTVYYAEEDDSPLRLSEHYVMLEDNAGSDIYTYAVTVRAPGVVTANVVDMSVATVSYTNGKATLTAVGVGKTKLIVEANGETKECVVEVASYGLEYELVADLDDEGKPLYYMNVYAGDSFNSANLYIPGYAYFVEFEEYLPVKRIKDAPFNNMGGVLDGGAFQPELISEDNGERIYANSPIVTAYTGDNVEVIAPGAFRNCNNLKSVKFGPATVKVDMYAFDQCTSLDTIDWGDSKITMINRCAFANCGFTEIDLPATVDFIGDSTFNFNTKLKKVKINGPITQIMSGTFMRCDVLEEIWLPASLKEIDNLTFYMADEAWNELNITWDTIVHFAGDMDLWEALLENALNAKVNTFLNPQYNPNLVVICEDDGNARIILDNTQLKLVVEAQAMIKVITANTSGVITAVSSDLTVARIIITGNVITVTAVSAGSATITVSIDDVYATCQIMVADFANLAGNVMVGMGESAKFSVGDKGTVSVTTADASIATATYMDGVVTLTGVSYGKTTLTIGSDTCTVWVGTAGLTYAIDNDDPTALVVSDGKGRTDNNIYIPGYATADGVNYLPVKTIAADGFKEKQGITSIYTGDNVVTVGKKAFYNIDGTLTTIKCGATLKVIEDGAFEDCEETFMTIDWGESQVETIGMRAFGWCGFESITIPRTVTSLGKYVFQGCEALREVKILCDDLEVIEEFSFAFNYVAFDSDVTLTFYISKGVKAISYNAFRPFGDNSYGCNVVINYEGTAEEYATLIETANNNSDKYGYNTLVPGSADGTTTIVNYNVDFSEL